MMTDSFMGRIEKNSGECVALRLHYKLILFNRDGKNSPGFPLRFGSTVCAPAMSLTVWVHAEHADFSGLFPGCPCACDQRCALGAGGLAG
jgi:hypothetical protein